MSASGWGEGCPSHETADMDTFPSVGSFIQDELAFISRIEVRSGFYDP